MALVKVQIVPLGKITYGGKPWNITPEMVASMVSYYESTRGKSGQALVIDYDHQTLDSDKTGVIARAAGWMKKLVADDKLGLCAMVEWTPNAEQMIKAKEFGYISPVIVKNHADETTGQAIPYALINAALTNVPFIPTMQAVAARVSAFVASQSGTDAEYMILTTEIDSPNNSQSTGGNPMAGAKAPSDLLAQIISAAELPADTTPDDLVAFVKLCAQFVKQVPEKMENEEGQAGPDASPQDQVAAADESLAMGQQGIKCRNDILKVLKLGKKTDNETVVARIASLVGGGSSEVATLRAELETLKKKSVASDCDTFIAANRKRITPANEEAIREFYMDNPERTIRMVAKMQELDLEKVITHADDKKVVGDDEPTEEEITAAMRTGSFESKDKFIASWKKQAQIRKEIRGEE